MFEFLKGKQKQDVLAVATDVATLDNPKNYPLEVLEIHKEFHCAANRLLVQANEIIAEASTKDAKKVSRLESLGFKQASQVAEIKPLLQKAEVSKEQIELLRYYALNYPNNKFISEEQVEAICLKYNLVCGEVSRFKGFVPDVNLTHIEKFALKEVDQIVTGICWGKISGHRYEHRISVNRFNELIKAGRINGKGKGDLRLDDNWCDASLLGINDAVYYDRISNIKLQICAPVRDMDISGLTLEDGYKLKTKFIPDPVVLQPVKEGYLIVTAWGDEASDELVVNQRHN